MKSVASIVDGQFLLHRLKDALKLEKYPEVNIIKEFLHHLADEKEEIYRIFFYQGEPSNKKQKNLFLRKKLNLKTLKLHFIIQIF